MTPKLEKWAIVLAGHWNRMIFTPHWVGKHMFPGGGEIETMVALLPVLPLVYQDAQVSMEVSQSRLEFRPRAANDTILQRAERMAGAVLQELDDTPLVGVGINFAFREPNPPNAVLDLFNTPDGPALAGEAWDIQERRIVRKLVRDRTVLNLTLAYGSEGVDFEFNFHTETTANAAARQAVDARAVGLKNTALQMLDNIYHLQPAPEGDNDE